MNRDEIEYAINASALEYAILDRHGLNARSVEIHQSHQDKIKNLLYNLDVARSTIISNLCTAGYFTYAEQNRFVVNLMAVEFYEEKLKGYIQDAHTANS